MKQVFTLLVAVLLTATVLAQSPEKMSYQAVIRNTSDVLVTNTSIGMQISILQDSASGTAVYTETQTPTTNANGLVNIEIGAGTVVSGDFTTIDWANGSYFIKTETDLAGGINYTITGTSQLLSVPYALHAKTAENITGGSSSNDYYLGQDTLGGIVFYIYIGSDGHNHGLIVSKADTVEQWQSTTSTTNATRSWDGEYNTNLMTNSPAKIWITTNFSIDWYLPSIDELSILWHNRYIVNKSLNNAGVTLLSQTAVYWCSTERNATNSFAFSFFTGLTTNYSKADYFNIRAVRTF